MDYKRKNMNNDIDISMSSEISALSPLSVEYHESFVKNLYKLLN